MLAQLFTLLAAGEASNVKRRLRLALLSYVAAFIAALLAMIFVVLAAYIAAAFTWGALPSAIGFAIGFGMIAAAILIAYRIASGIRHRERQRQRAADATMLASASAVTAIPAMLGKKGALNPLLLALVGIGGFAAYRQFQQRSRKNGR